MQPKNENAQLFLGRIATRLHAIFDGLIDLSDVTNRPPEQLESFFRTRSLAALTLMDETSITAEHAATCVTDGGNDGGIDAVYIDNTRKIVFLVQSKWRGSGKGIDLGDFTRFRDGVKDVISLNWRPDNSNLHRFKTDLELALNDIDTSLRMVFVHTSEHEIAPLIQLKIDEFTAAQNFISADFLEFKQVDLSGVARAARAKSRPENINVSALIQQWGMKGEPYKALYGSISATDVVRWYEEHNIRLFAENLRYTIEKSSVNDGIIDTAQNNPESFWYYNNGITAICDSFHKQPIGGDDTSEGVFDIKRISVINGAQTIGSLARAKLAGSPLSRVRVHIRIISLVDTPDGFSIYVTNANNTQNDLSAMDFVAADPNQDRVQREAATLQLRYVFRRGDSEPKADGGFDIRSATIAAACSSGDLKLAVASKRYISGLWQDTKKEPYIKIFNDDTSAISLWYAVRVMRLVDKVLAELASGMQGRDKLIAVHGNRFILFCLFELMKSSNAFGDDKATFAGTTLKTIVSLLLEKVVPLVNELFPDAYPGNVFKNNDRQKQLLDDLAMQPGISFPKSATD